jgi:hypothetical protein
MKILTINVNGIPSSRSDNLIHANVFQDYNAVVVDPENFESLYGHISDLYHDRNERRLALRAGGIISTVNQKRREQVIGLLQRGGIVVCFMQPSISYNYNWCYDGEDHWIYVTNYDWLLKPEDIEKELGEIKYDKGTTIDYIDSGHPFSEYLNIKPSWSAYVEKDACKNWKVLASAFGTHALSLAKRVGLGHIILLPSDYDYNNDVILERCIVKLFGDREITPQPDWAKSIRVPGQEELISKVIELSDQIDALQKQKQTYLDANDKLERWKYLLYAKGKHQLEPVVREALALLGCKVEPQPDKDSDGAVRCEYGIALLEVVGSQRTIKIEKFGELKKNMGNFIQEKGDEIKGVLKGILVGNPFCDDKYPGNRPPKDSQKQLFASQLIESAEKQDISLLLSTDLYEVVSRILSDKLSKTEKQSLRERIFNGRGLVRLV